MDTAVSTQTLTERIIEAILANGGTEEDIQYFTDEMATDMGKQLATKGAKARTPNPAYIVTPVNDIQGSLDKFDWHYDWIKKQKLVFKVDSSDGPKTIELIKCTPASTDATLKEIDSLGFMPAPSPYLLGLGVQHPDVIKEHEWIVSLDDANLLPDEYGDLCFLDLDWRGERDLFLTERDGEWRDDWWFAVVRK